MAATSNPYNRRYGLKIEDTTDPAAPVIGYKLTRPDCGGWLFAGTTPEEVAEAVKNEIDSNEGLSAEECGQLVIEAYETTQSEIDAMPEFPGW